MRKIMLTVILLLSIPVVLSAFVSTDKNNYQPGDTVFISGSGFPSNIDVIIQINDPTDTVKFVDQIRADNGGKFSTTYVIPNDAITGYYTIYSSGGGIQTQKNFTVTSIPVTTTIPSDGNGRNGGTTTTILTETTTTQREATTSTLGVTTTVPEEKRPIINPRTITIVGVATIVLIIIFLVMKGLANKTIIPERFY